MTHRSSNLFLFCTWPVLSLYYFQCSSNCDMIKDSTSFDTMWSIINGPIAHLLHQHGCSTKKKMKSLLSELCRDLCPPKRLHALALCCQLNDTHSKIISVNINFPSLRSNYSHMHCMEMDISSSALHASNVFNSQTKQLRISLFIN